MCINEELALETVKKKVTGMIKFMGALWKAEKTGFTYFGK